jgi:enoyl-[acyl-carrier-protein] reductase (NADH)
MSGMHGKVGLVTGVGSKEGIGMACAKLLAVTGAHRLQLLQPLHASMMRLQELSGGQHLSLIAV